MTKQRASKVCILVLSYLDVYAMSLLTKNTEKSHVVTFHDIYQELKVG